MARTALELSPQEWKDYDPASVIRRRQVLERQDLTRRRRQALRVARKAAQLLREEFGAQKVMVFGSLTKPGQFTRWSDIDLAAWGILPERFFAAVAGVTGLSSTFKIDLVDPEFCRPSLRTAIEQEGKTL